MAWLKKTTKCIMSSLHQQWDDLERVSIKVVWIHNSDSDYSSPLGIYLLSLLWKKYHFLLVHPSPPGLGMLTTAGTYSYHRPFKISITNVVFVFGFFFFFNLFIAFNWKAREVGKWIGTYFFYTKLMKVTNSDTHTHIHTHIHIHSKVEKDSSFTSAEFSQK